MNTNNKKKILFIGTGGTISSQNSGEGLSPAMDAQELLRYCPDIINYCDVKCIQILNLDSTNMRPGHWILMAQAIEENYNDYDGFVIAHGTDTMAYSASAVSYLIQDSPKPVVFTGAQKPIDVIGSDAIRNLTDAFIVASDDNSHGVQIVFFGSVICGTRARKNFSKSFGAFGSINFPEIARIQDGRIARFIVDEVPSKPNFYSYLNPNVGLIKLVPGMSADILNYIINQCDGIVVESFGVGGLPEYSDFYNQIKEAADKGKVVVMTTQVPSEGSNLGVYRVGSKLKDHLRILEAHDMTTESAITKLMWILGQAKDFDEAETLFYTTIYHDILYKD